MSDHHYLAQNWAGWARGKTPAEALKKLHDESEFFEPDMFWRNSWFCYLIPAPLLPKNPLISLTPPPRDGALLQSQYSPSPPARHPTGEAAQ